MGMLLPPPLATEDLRQAVRLVRGYLAPARSVAGGVAFTGALFDTWAEGGDPHEFGDDDINAVAMLSVEIPPRAVIELLMRKRSRLSALLRDIPTELDLHAAPAKVVAPGSTSDKLWHELVRIPDVGWVTAGKLCARKRPQLLPVYDQHVKRLVGSPANFWTALHEALTADAGALVERLETVRSQANAAHISLLRIFDIVAWRYATGM